MLKRGTLGAPTSPAAFPEDADGDVGAPRSNNSSPRIFTAYFYRLARRRADAEPVDAEGVATGDPVGGREREELEQGEFLAAIEHVALILGDDEGEAGDLAGEVAQLDASKIGDWDVGGAPDVAAQAVDFGLDGPQLFVGDDEEISRAAGGIEDADAGEALGADDFAEAGDAGSGRFC